MQDSYAKLTQSFHACPMKHETYIFSAPGFHGSLQLSTSHVPSVLPNLLCKSSEGSIKAQNYLCNTTSKFSFVPHETRNLHVQFPQMPRQLRVLHANASIAIARKYRSRSDAMGLTGNVSVLLSASPQLSKQIELWFYKTFPNSMNWLHRTS